VLKKLILILILFYGLVNQVSARFIPASVYENSYRHSLVSAENNINLNILSHLLKLSHVKESHDMEVVENIEIFTDKNHAGYTFIESTSTISYLKTTHCILKSCIDDRVFRARSIRLILFPFHDFV